MVKVEILVDIKHEGAQFHAGELRVLDEGTAGYFCGNGWAKRPGDDAVSPDTSPKTLTIEPAKHGHDNPGAK